FRNVEDRFHVVAADGAEPEFVRFIQQHPIPLAYGTLVGRVGLERRTIYFEDAATDPRYTWREALRRGGFRSNLGVPLMRKGAVVGVINLFGGAPSMFSDNQIRLVETFAEQAVIAMENVRLFEELRQRTDDLAEALQQQTATSEVLKVISRSTFDLPSLLSTLVESAARLSDADKATITREIDGRFYRAEAYGFSPEFLEFARRQPVERDHRTVTGRALVEGRVIHIPDVDADPEYDFGEGRQFDKFRTILGVPMLKEGRAVGVFALTRVDVRPFTARQIEMVSTFADQAAIAIENSRLFESVQARTRELAHSLAELQAAQDRLVQTEKLASLGQLTAGIAHEIKNPLNFVNNFSSLSIELLEEMSQILSGMSAGAGQHAELAEIGEMLRGNLEKIVQHGKRADSIIRNMLLHSRAGSGERQEVEINAIVEEAVNLAYHGARAEKPGLTVILLSVLDPAAGKVDAFPQELTRVLLNLFSNGLHATAKRRQQDNDARYEPTLTVSTRDLGGEVEIRIRDNGTGIPLEIQDRIFNPFFTTKPPGEGTGLGLSLSHDIVVKQHGGSIAFSSTPGEYTEFRIVLPRGGVSDAGRARSGQ
ncbi:MAG: GAF domain-containing protein, partial [Alphaproteobacteria bacterium]|nr:GAF domain-containing protein [Alphaproteobacteria bacterium]